MVTGKPLITDKQFEQLLANAPKSLEEMEYHDPRPVVKIFLPHIRWLLVHGYSNDLERFFCVVKFAQDDPEAGDVPLSDTVNARLGMTRPEQDLYIKLDKPWSYYLDNGSDW